MTIHVVKQYKYSCSLIRKIFMYPRNTFIRILKEQNMPRENEYFVLTIHKYSCAKMFINIYFSKNTNSHCNRAFYKVHHSVKFRAWISCHKLDSWRTVHTQIYFTYLDRIYCRNISRINFGRPRQRLWVWLRSDGIPTY